MRRQVLIVLWLSLVVALTSCYRSSSTHGVGAADSTSVMRHAQLLTLERGEAYTVATVADPWRGGVLRRQGSVLCETALDRTMDCAVEFECRDGECRVVGYSVFDVDAHNQYAGGLVDATATLHALIAARYSALDEVVEALRQTLTTLVAPHYAGPLGADMILYRTSTGSTSINPCVELNLRHTMGMVAAALGQRHAMRGRFVIAPPTTPHRLALTPTSARQAALLV